LLKLFENNHKCVPFGLLITNINLLLAVFQLDQNRGALRPAPEIVRLSALLSHPLRPSALFTIPLRPSALSTIPLRPSALFMPYMNSERVFLLFIFFIISRFYIYFE
jgi:hypothetical protein